MKIKTKTINKQKVIDNSVGLGFDELYSQLNAEQKMAVNKIEGPVMVLAGPGTGKTQVLAMRVARILKETQMDPWNILCLTFTESGVVAMRERLAKIIGISAYAVRIHTFHSFCNDVIQEHAERFEIAAGGMGQALSDGEKIEVLQDILNSLPGTSKLKPFGSPYMYINAVLDNIQDLKQEDISSSAFGKVVDAMGRFVLCGRGIIDDFHSLKPKERDHACCVYAYEKLMVCMQKSGLPASVIAVLRGMLEKYEEKIGEAENDRALSSGRTAFKNEVKKWFDRMELSVPKHKDLQVVYTKYEKWVRKMDRYDYADMILQVIDAFEKDDALLAEYQEQFQYLLVDEYQDTNGAQNAIVSLLGSFDDSPNIFVVGDDKQSIYRFQGASLSNMLDFYEKYSGNINVISLKNNYRSQGVILSAAGSVIEENEESIGKYIPEVSHELVPASGGKEQNIEEYIFSSEDVEDYFVMDRVRLMIESGVQPSSIAVLFRYNKDGKELLRMMKANHVPARLEQGEDALEDIVVNQFLALLAYIGDTRRDEVLSEVLLYDWMKLPVLDALKVIHYTGMRRKSFIRTLFDKEVLKECGVERPEQFQELVSHIAKWKQLDGNVTLQNFLTTVLEESGLMDYILAKKEKLSSLRSITSLFRVAKDMNVAKPSMALNDFLEHISLLREHNMSLVSDVAVHEQSLSDAVRLMTAHKAKGLEFEHVIMIRLNDKHWGNVRDFNKLPLPHGFVRFDRVVAQENNEDERRLFYVAMTRAKQSLTFTRSSSNAGGKPTTVSMFVEEVKGDFINRFENKEEEKDEITRFTESTLAVLPGDGDIETEAWVESLLKGYMMSVTHLNNYLDCPRKFYVRNILHVPSARTKHQAMGTAVHVALDDFYGRDVQKKDLLLDLFEMYLKRELLTSVDYDDVLAIGKEQLSGYYKQYAGEFSKETKREYSFKSHGVVVNGVSITGNIDKIELLDEEWGDGARVNVVDYKTGNPDRGMLKIRPGEDYHRQLVFYRLLCDESSQFIYEFTSAEIDFITPSVKKGYLKKKVNVSDAEVDELKKTIACVWSEIRDLKFLDDAMVCGECEYCT